MKGWEWRLIKCPILLRLRKPFSSRSEHLSQEGTGSCGPSPDSSPAFFLLLGSFRPKQSSNLCWNRVVSPQLLSTQLMQWLPWNRKQQKFVFTNFILLCWFQTTSLLFLETFECISIILWYVLRLSFRCKHFLELTDGRKWWQFEIVSYLWYFNQMLFLHIFLCYTLRLSLARWATVHGVTKSWTWLGSQAQHSIGVFYSS